MKSFARAFVILCVRRPLFMYVMPRDRPWQETSVSSVRVHVWLSPEPSLRGLRSVGFRCDKRAKATELPANPSPPPTHPPTTIILYSVVCMSSSTSDWHAHATSALVTSGVPLFDHSPWAVLHLCGARRLPDAPLFPPTQ
ncbi:hypothetical protein GW17_00022893 [Ensete ventricosum]|nr:hypothetical protein GW17_00022893 [Ensete ventricosum]